MVSTLADDFMSLFDGRHDAVGTEEGGALRRPAVTNDYWWDRQIHDHLRGEPCGVYPLTPRTHARPDGGWDAGWFVKWGCVDFDEGDAESWVHACNLQEVLHQMGVTAWIERSRSKGYHVWVFLGSWMSARLVREALLGACQVVGAPTKEINPKSIAFDDHATLGNYVRLPYPGGLRQVGTVWPERRVMVRRDGSVVPLQQFVESALASLATLDAMRKLQSLYEPPKRYVPPPMVAPEGDIYKRMSGLAWTIFKDGPIEDMGRGHTLFKLACVLAEHGAHTFSEVYELCLEADRHWGKFHERADGERQVLKCVERAFGNG